jgi:hypothetical protein
MTNTPHEFGLYVQREAPNGLIIEKRALRPDDKPGELIYNSKGESKIKFLFLTREGIFICFCC